MAGGSTFGTPSASNKFLTQDYNSSATGLPVVRRYTTTDTVYGAVTSQFDITNPIGTTFRYTWDGNGTDPGITALLFPIGSGVVVQGQNFNSANNGIFVITGSGASYFEVTNASGVAEINKTLGTGYISRIVATWAKPAGLKYITVEVQAPGSSGAGAATASQIQVGTGGSSGGYSKKTIQASSLAATEVPAVGANNTSGTFAIAKIAGFGSHLYATGGQTAGAAPGNGFNGDINIEGQRGGPGLTSSTGNDGVGLGYGGNSILGLGGQSRYTGGSDDQPGYDGTGYGSGGSGAYNTNNAGNPQNGGLGTQGIVIITEYFS